MSVPETPRISLVSFNTTVTNHPPPTTCEQKKPPSLTTGSHIEAFEASEAAQEEDTSRSLLSTHLPPFSLEAHSNKSFTPEELLKQGYYGRVSGSEKLIAAKKKVNAEADDEEEED